jgi:hypothetical protein
MSLKQKRTPERNIAAISRAIRKFGDSDGKRKQALLELKGKPKKESRK